MITVIGSINLDLVANVDRLPGPGETVPGTSFVTSPGGKGANQALAARRAGAQVRMIGAVGSDGFADPATALLDASGIDLSGVRRVAGSTGTALILVSRDGENMIAVVPGANDAVSPSSLDDLDLQAEGIVLLQQEIPIATIDRLLDRTADAGGLTILNTAPFKAETASLLHRASIIVSNETEFDLYASALSLAGADRISRMEAFVARTGRTLVVTLGAQGVQVAGPQGSFRVAAPAITPVDTVGAGDTFCGYLAAGLGSSESLRRSVEFAARAGALACLKPGAQPSIPYAADVDRMG